MKNRKFKQTEIGTIPEEWDVLRVGDLVRINESIITKSYTEEVIEYIDTSSVENGMLVEVQILALKEAPSRARRIVKDNDILLSTVRPNLKHFFFVTKSKKNLVASTGFAVISAKKINPKFLYYYLTTDKYTGFLSAIADSHTSTYPSFNPDIIESSFCPVPKEGEQITISKILSSLDSKIELLQEQNKTLEAIGQAIFKRWFVDFEFPDENGKPYKSSGGKMVESEMGMIPEGWRVDSIYKSADVIYGAPFSSDLFNKEKRGLPLIRIRDLKDSNPEFYTTQDHPKGTVINAGDIIAGMDAEFRPYIWLGQKSYLNQRLCYFKPKNGFHRYFILQTIRPLLRFFENAKVGTTVIHLGKSDIDTCRVIIPDERIKRMFFELVDGIFNQIVNNSTEIRTLSATRDSILPKLMSGRIRVPVEDV